MVRRSLVPARSPIRASSSWKGPDAAVRRSAPAIQPGAGRLAHLDAPAGVQRAEGVIRLDDWRRGLAAHRATPRRTIQIKCGPPMKAVIAPAGISAGAIRTRPSASQRREQHAAQQERARHQQPVVGAETAAQQVRHHQSDEADRAGQRHGGRRQDRAREVSVDQRAPDVGAARGGPCLAHRQQVPLASLADHHDGEHRRRRPHRRAGSTVRSRPVRRSATARWRTTATRRSGRAPAG